MSAGYRGDNYIWYEKLGILSLLAQAIAGLFAEVSVVCYDEKITGSLTKNIIRFSQKIGFLGRFRSVDLTLNMKDSRGYALNYALCRDMVYCIDGFCVSTVASCDDRYKNMLKSYLASRLYDRMAFIAMAHAEATRLKGGSHRIYVRWNPLNDIILKYYKGKGVDIRCLHLDAELAKTVRIYTKSAYLLVRSALSCLTSNKVRGDLDSSKPSIWIEYNGYTSIKSARLSFWRKYVKSRDFEIVYYLDRPDSPPSDDIIEDIKRLNMKWLDSRDVFKLAKLGVGDIWRLMKRISGCVLRTPLWLYFLNLEKIIFYFIYNKIYKLYNVKLLVQHQESSWLQEVQTEAIESAGGIMLGFHWSNLPSEIY